MQNNDSDLSLEKPSQSGQPRRPLAERMRPQTLGEIVGQNHILGEGCSTKTSSKKTGFLIYF